MNTTFHRYINKHGLQFLNSTSQNNYQLINQAGFTFNFKHIIVDGEYYKAEQEERVEGIDGSFRWHQFLTITYTGLLMFFHHGLLKFVLDWVPFLRRIYENGPLIFKI